MKKSSSQLTWPAKLLALAAVAFSVCGFVEAILAADQPAPPQSSPPAFDGGKSTWHDGFVRYDFTMDDQTLAISPFTRPEKERFAVGNSEKGTRRCIVVVPTKPAPGNPWSWRGCYWDHQPQAEVELLHRGFYIAFITPDPGRQYPGKQWNAWYAYLTEKHGLSKKPAFVGMSKGGVNEYTWATSNPDKVSCVYADNPGIYPEDIPRIGELIKHDVPLLNVCGTEDFVLEKNTKVIENIYHQSGGQISIMIKEGMGHHPHSLVDPKPIADFIEQHVQPNSTPRPEIVDDTFTKSHYYSTENSYIYLTKEDTYATCRGPQFTPCYDRYDKNGRTPFGVTGWAVLVPKTEAAGKPWVFRADRIDREASAIDLALLAKGFYIVAAPYLGQGPVREEWDAVYKNMTDHGFSKKPVMEGAGAGAGEAYAWASENPDKVSCIYGENPVLRSIMSGRQEKKPPLDNLAPLAKAGVPILHVCGQLDPWLDRETRVAEKRYKEFGGQMTVIVREGEGHFPLSRKDPKSVVDFIISVGLKSAPSDKAALPKDPPRQGQAPDGVELLRDIEIGTGGGRALHADIARPKTPPAGLMPAVLWIHGGGWTSGSHHDFQQTIQLANHGYLVLGVEYRFVNEAIWPAQIEDCKLAVRWLRANAAKYQVDPDRIGCWGTSAGGHLAGLMGVTADKPDLEGKGGSAGFSSAVQAVVDFCGPTQFKGSNFTAVSRKMAGGTYEEKTDVYKQMSPLDNVNPKACPFLFVNGERDTTVPVFHAELMTEALKKVNVPVELIIVKNAGHGYVFVAPRGGPPAQPSPAEVDAAVLKFLDANLKK